MRWLQATKQNRFKRKGDTALFTSFLKTSKPPLQEQLINFEAMCYFVESVVGNVSQRYLPGGRRQPGLVVASDPGTVASIVDKLEGMFGMLLGLHFHHPVMITYLARLLEAFSRLLALRKQLAAPAIEKVWAPPKCDTALPSSLTAHTGA